MEENEKASILVVDDERDLCNIISYNLQTVGYSVDVAYSGEDALTLIEQKDYQLLLLDIMMGGISGLDVARQVKANITRQAPPIIFLTAKDTEDDILQGFNIGADDYISKPFRVRELIARCQAVLRRSHHDIKIPATDTRFRLDDQKKILMKGEERVLLNPTEYGIMKMLISRPGRVFSRQELTRAWPQDVIVLERTVDVAINRLRHKLGDDADRIVARPGFGYYFE